MKFDERTASVVVVAQDAITGRVLMVANADREALEETLRTGEMHYRSRTRGLWHKGATSGNVQQVISLAADCDGDTILAQVISEGPACHTGDVSCFAGGAASPNAFSALDDVIAVRVNEPEPIDSSATTRKKSYTRKLLGDRNLRLKKIGEESAELVAACADGDASRATEEAADLIYHIAVALQSNGSSLNEVSEVLFRRSAASNPVEAA